MNWREVGALLGISDEDLDAIADNDVSEQVEVEEIRAPRAEGQ